MTLSSPVPLTDFQAFMRRRLLLCLEESKAGIAATEITTNAHYFWTYTHQLQLDELDAFDRGEGIWWIVPDTPPARTG